MSRLRIASISYDAVRLRNGVSLALSYAGEALRASFYALITSPIAEMKNAFRRFILARRRARVYGRYAGFLQALVMIFRCDKLIFTRARIITCAFT